jgi:hypothetical protein
MEMRGTSSFGARAAVLRKPASMLALRRAIPPLLRLPLSQPMTKRDDNSFRNSETSLIAARISSRATRGGIDGVA